MADLRDAGPIWLDITRLVSRVGRGILTGIDRVELAYLEECLRIGSPDTRYLCRSTRGYLLSDHRGGRLLADLVRGGLPLGRADWLSRIAGRGGRPRHRVEGMLRAVAVDRCSPGGLRRLRGRTIGPLTYINVGHSNLSEGTLAAFSADPRSCCVVMIHDLIPITHPQHVSEGLPSRFAGRMDRVRTHADIVLCNSAATRADLLAHWSDTDNAPAMIVAHLGVEVPAIGPVQKDPRAVIMLGTIEPRKNHGLMLDVWEALAREMREQDCPHLHIIGGTGWRVEALMARLSDHPLRDRTVFVHGPMSDPDMYECLARASALVFPSEIEGFGYPPLEAAMLGAVPICSDLPVFREILGDCGVYVNNPDATSWLETIKKEILTKDAVRHSSKPRVPTWRAHFATVGRGLATKDRKGAA